MELFRSFVLFCLCTEFHFQDNDNAHNERIYDCDIVRHFHGSKNMCERDPKRSKEMHKKVAAVKSKCRSVGWLSHALDDNYFSCSLARSLFLSLALTLSRSLVFSEFYCTSFKQIANYFLLTTFIIKIFIILITAMMYLSISSCLFNASLLFYGISRSIYLLFSFLSFSFDFCQRTNFFSHPKDWNS